MQEAITFTRIPCQICEKSDWQVLIEHKGPCICSGGEVVKNEIPLVKGMCRSCGFIYTLKSPLDLDLDDYYENQYSAKLEDMESDYFNFSTNASFAQTLNEFVLSYPFPSHGKMLDIGCGKGFFEEAFIDMYPEWRIEGIDPSSRSIELAKGRNPSAMFFNKKFEVSDFEKESYDIVAIHTVLNRVPAGKFLSDAVALLKPQGIMSIEIALFTQAPFQLFFADHTCLYYQEHFIFLAAKNGLTLLKEDLNGSLSRFLFKKVSTLDTVTVNEFSLQTQEKTKSIVKAWSELFSRVKAAAKEKKKVSFYGAGTSLAIILAVTDFPIDLVDGIYDDTPTKIGRKFWDLPIRKYDEKIKESNAIVLCAGLSGIEIMEKRIGKHPCLIHL